MSDQYAFAEIMEAAEEADRERADAHRTATHAFFDRLTTQQKDQLSELFHASEWLTCQTLSAAAGDYYRSERKHQLRSTSGNAREAVRCLT